MPGPTVLVVADPEASYLKPLERILNDATVVVTNDPESLRISAPAADVLVSGDFRDSRRFLETFPLATNVRWVHVLSAGIEKQLSPEIVASPVPMTNGRGVFSPPLGEWAMGVMIYFAYDFPRMLRNQRAHKWEAYSHEDLFRRTVTIVGYGDIGQAVGSRAEAFGMRVIPVRSNHTPREVLEAIAAADYVAVTAPLTEQTRGLVGAEQIAAMKASAVVINVGRGPVIDEAALVAALREHKIRGAALDVFDTEPLPGDHPFWAMENVIVSPHSADILANSREMAVECFVDNFYRFAKGEPLKNIVNKNAGY